MSVRPLRERLIYLLEGASRAIDEFLEDSETDLESHIDSRELQDVLLRLKRGDAL